MELLREAGPKGLHVKEIAARTRTQPGVLGKLSISSSYFQIPSLIHSEGRILRTLATHYVFREVRHRCPISILIVLTVFNDQVEPDVFANNRISSLFDTGKPSDYVIELGK